ncbi:probable copper-transporting ATPase HMA5 [Cryptomeria japonica]|uniref:probable copper-transporting ATPase HMA5 n=1 Tax=Cryptomeria japonica TaxID=3369 RepID=UPI0025AD06BC|nr:probable copper-transporting ATPase HMA5 [Cryptomeria japonica]XP_057845687.1 probable copper-transporting ATPase HMA5 [Cryptomeria japonica]XP_057845688.1 probable copper-transporting ATPase HMA5 [Cryptomeria japonica]XP_057845689.1 probable copper-transporting ATPase HMA5 [Cryptomeria japonica]XP_057845690.1 probable copper-transporting ATPase HMA5 [Cryptomeria japonica]XP_059077529.1 probable copper-transporting ATPase HMA5 [Cryptomeria japonica]
MYQSKEGCTFYDQMYNQVVHINTVGGALEFTDIAHEVSVAEDPQVQNALQVTFRVTGMDCSTCACSVEKVVRQIPGVVDSTISVLNNKALVLYQPASLNEKHIQKAIEDAGFEATLLEDYMKGRPARICRLRIIGMTCTACSSTIEDSLKKLSGVQKCCVALATEEAEISYDIRQIDPQQLIDAVEDMGFEAQLKNAGEDRDQVCLQLQGVNSIGAMKAIERSLQALPGVKSVEINANRDKVIVGYDPDLSGPRYFIEAVDQTKYELAQFKASLINQNLGSSRQERSKEVKRSGKYLLWSCILGVPVFLLSMVFMYIPKVKDKLDERLVNMLTIGELLRWVFCTPVQFIVGWQFYVGAYNSLRHGSANMDVLVALGTNAAYFYSLYSMIRAATSMNFRSIDFFETSAMLICFILLGKFLKVLAKGKTSEAIAKLMELAPEKATLLILDDGGNIMVERQISSDLIQRNDIIKVIPGDKIPTDGLVIWGKSHVNESMLTGEPRPVTKRIGDKVFRGTMNQVGMLHLRATHVGSETTLAKIVRLVETAQMQKAPVQMLADTISKYFVPMVVMVAFVTWLAWYIAGLVGSYPKSWIPPSMGEFELSLQFGISVLVIACPCALGLATPTAVMVGTGKGASLGVLIKGGLALQNAHKVKCVVFDKTGTLTTGKPIVVGTKCFTTTALMDFYNIVASAEANSEHPLAKAIVEHTKNLRSINDNSTMSNLLVAEDFQSVTGQGIRALVNNKQVVVGNRQMMVASDISIPEDVNKHLKDVEKEARTGVLVAFDAEIVGLIAISDPVKPEAKEVVSMLGTLGLRTIMVTGDNWGTAKSIAKEVGIESVTAEVPPHGKVEKIRQLQADGLAVAMVGDGINDAPALVAADVGMAIGAGTDIAIEAADIVLVRSNLVDVITAIDLSRKTFFRIKLNYIWAFGYNILGIPIAAGVLFPFTGFRFPPWVAGAAMATSSLSVVCSSLLLRYYVPPKQPSALTTEEMKSEFPGSKAEYFKSDGIV